MAGAQQLDFSAREAAVLGAGGRKIEWSIILFCPVVQQMYMHCLGIRPALPQQALTAFLLLDRESQDVPTQRALGVYALHRCYNGPRYGGLTGEDLHGAFREFVLDGRLSTETLSL